MTTSVRPQVGLHGLLGSLLFTYLGSLLFIVCPYLTLCFLLFPTLQARTAAPWPDGPDGNHGESTRSLLWTDGAPASQPHIHSICKILYDPHLRSLQDPILFPALHGLLVSDQETGAIHSLDPVAQELPGSAYSGKDPTWIISSVSPEEEGKWVWRDVVPPRVSSLLGRKAGYK